MASCFVTFTIIDTPGIMLLVQTIELNDHGFIHFENEEGKENEKMS